MIEADVVVVGSLNHDITVGAERRPTAGETVLGRSLASASGGKGANQAVAAAHAGARVAMVGCVGADAAGESLLAALQAAGVDTQHVRVLDDEPTGTALIVVDDAGENAIVVVPGANARLAAGDVHTALGGAAADARLAEAARAGSGAPVVLAQLEVPDAAVAAAARAARRFVLNASPARAIPAEVLTVADPLIVNAREAAVLTGADEHDVDALAAAALALGARSVVITRGADGATWATPEARFEQAAPAVQVVDTTGAGDVVAGTLAAWLALGADARAALAAAVEAGTAAVQWHGAQRP